MASSPSPPPKPPPTKSPPPKKTPPIPWSHQETLALIQAYQDKWYSLKRGQLKAFQWEEVAAAVAARCSLLDQPSKTSTQCRHKIEKLRKRYRSEMQNPHPKSWPYLHLMDRMEQGPIAAVAKSSPTNNPANNNNNIVNHGNYGSSISLYSSPADYYNNNGNSRGGSDESDEEWSDKSKSINNIVRGVRTAKRSPMESGFISGSTNRVARILRNPINGKRKEYYDVDDSSDDDNDDDVEENEEEEEQMPVEDEEEEEGGVGIELAAEIKGFAERFMRMENKKIEMMREIERYRMEMEKKRMEMILEAQRKIVDTIGRAFGGDHNKKAKMAQES